MDEKRALKVVDRLREQGIDAHVERASTYVFGVRVQLRDGRNAVWDTDGTLGLEAQVMRNGMLVGFVPQLEGSEDFDDEQTIAAIAGTDYDKPIATRRTTPLPPAAPLPRQGGVFRRFLGGFRE
ncbi:MAG: hypothetical protein JWO12_1382 [Frankiales bacterium]|nr:hypothetical protein [Frankiales bacterium]